MSGVQISSCPLVFYMLLGRLIMTAGMCFSLAVLGAVVPVISYTIFQVTHELESLSFSSDMRTLGVIKPDKTVWIATEEPHFVFDVAKGAGDVYGISPNFKHQKSTGTRQRVKDTLHDVLITKHIPEPDLVLQIDNPITALDMEELLTLGTRPTQVIRKEYTREGLSLEEMRELAECFEYHTHVVRYPNYPPHTLVVADSKLVQIAQSVSRNHWALF